MRNHLLVLGPDHGSRRPCITLLVPQAGVGSSHMALTCSSILRPSDIGASSKVDIRLEMDVYLIDLLWLL